MTVPHSWIHRPLFGMDIDVSLSNPHAKVWYAYELAAMDVSRRLLLACDREKLYYGYDGELDNTSYDILQSGDHEHARRILRRRGILRTPKTPSELEVKIRRRLYGANSD